MAFTDIEYQAVKNEVEAFVESRRPPPHLRDQMDLDYRIYGCTVELFQVRPAWLGVPGELTELPVVKIIYLRSQDEWELYWQRGNLKWECYETVYTLAEALELVRKDRDGCFRG